MNPYRPAPGSEPPFLAGRDTEISLALAAIESTRAGGAARPIVLVGLRGTGKTALLRRFEHLAKKQSAVVITGEATMQGSLAATLRAGFEEARRELAPLSTRLREAFDAVISVLPEASYELPHELGAIDVKMKRSKELERLQAALEDLNRAFRKHNRWLAIALDEVQQADVHTLDSIISTVHKTAGTTEPILFLGAGLRNARAHLKGVRTYTERWRFLELGLLSLPATMDALQEPARKEGESFSSDALRVLAQDTRGYPFFVQEYASTIWSERDARTKNISIGTVRAILPAIKTSLERDFYSDPLRRLSAREISYVGALASLGNGDHPTGDVAAIIGLTSAGASSIRQQLIRKDIIYTPDRGVVEFRIPLMDEYVNAHAKEFKKLVDRRISLRGELRWRQKR